MPKEIYYLLALIVGFGVASQAGVNSQLNLATGNPAVTSLISFLVGTAILLVYVLVTSYNSLPTLQMLASTKWWQFTGGMFGVVYIASMVILAPKIGAANALGLVIAGQLIAAIIYDNFGWIGFPVKPVSILRIVGVILLIAGVYLIRRF